MRLSRLEIEALIAAVNDVDLEGTFEDDQKMLTACERGLKKLQERLAEITEKEGD